MAPSITSTILFISIFWVILKLGEYFKKLYRLRSLPVANVVFSAGTAIGNVFPPSMRRISRGGLYPHTSKYRDFKEAGWNVMATMAPLPYPHAMVYIADASIIKEIVSNRARFPKPLPQYEAVRIFGDNVVASEGEEWKKHRKISQPAFSEQNNRLVWNSSLDIMSELYEEVWGNKDEVFVKNTLELGIKVALMVLGIAGFGKEMSWKSQNTIQEGYQMEFAKALYTVSADLVTNFITPNWAMNATPKLREMKLAFEELGKHMDEIIEERKRHGQAKREGKWDLLTNLIAASDEGADGDENAKLTFLELRGNIFVYLIAGHETTAHTLTYVFGLLAIHPEEQDKLYTHIKEVLGDRHPTYDDAPSLTRVLATFHETLRLFPAVTTIPKSTTEDTIFTVTSADHKSNQTKNMFVPANTMLILHTPGLHYNPQYWDNPMDFRPDRFLGNYNRDAFLPFSGGARSCIGRKFSETEGVAILTSIISNYTIHLAPPQEAEYAGVGYQITNHPARSDQTIQPHFSPADI